MAYSRDAFNRENTERLERNQREIRERLERDGAMADGLSQPKKIAGESYKERESQRGDIELFRQIDDKRTDRQTNRRTYRAIP